METLFIYLIKTSGLTALFYLAYYFLLRKETFFTGNRWFLLAGIVTSTVLPVLTYTKTVWVAAAPSSFDWSKIPMTTAVEKETFEIDWYLILGVAYAIGIVLFLLKFAFDFYSLNKVLEGKPVQKQADFKFIDCSENKTPFSYFDTIVYNSSLYSPSELENILEHEKVHSEQNHTLDVLISRLFCIVFWFNPFVWLYKKAILQNLEFIADSEALKKLTDKKAYQITLLKITTHENCVVLTNHFYQSLIKKRIVMLNKNQSKKWNSWKYAVILPVLVVFVLLFQVEAIAQKSTEQSTKTVTADLINYAYTISKETSDNAINSEIKKFKNKFNATIVFSGIKRNSKNEIIALKVEISSPDGTKNTFTYSDNQAIEYFQIFSGKFKNNIPVVGLYNGNSKSNRWKQTVRYNIPPPPPPVARKINSAIPPPAKQKNNTITPPPPPAVKKNNSIAPPPPPVAIKIIATNTAEKFFFSEKAMIVIDGEKADSQININDINTDAIENVSVFKGKLAVEKYGEDGKNGVIEITTKNNAAILKSSPRKD
jgi:hypothetical protein